MRRAPQRDRVPTSRGAARPSGEHPPRPRIAVVGAGRCGSALAVAAHAAGYRVTAVASRTPENARALAVRVGADAVEFQTASYSEAVGPAAVEEELATLHTAAAHAKHAGLHVHMGHGLNYTNVQAVTRIPGVEELNIGHSIVSRAMLVGMERAVREMREAIAIAAQEGNLVRGN